MSCVVMESDAPTSMILPSPASQPSLSESLEVLPANAIEIAIGRNINFDRPLFRVTVVAGRMSFNSEILRVSIILCLFIFIPSCTVPRVR